MHAPLPDSMSSDEMVVGAKAGTCAGSARGTAVVATARVLAGQQHQPSGEEYGLVKRHLLQTSREGGAVLTRTLAARGLSAAATVGRPASRAAAVRAKYAAAAMVTARAVAPALDKRGGPSLQRSASKRGATIPLSLRSSTANHY